MNIWPRVGIIVLNWNGGDDTLACLESLARLDYPAFEVVVVDNGSTDGSVHAIRERFPGVTLIENGENLGYAVGNNVGLRYALGQGANYALLLNNDTVVAPDFLRVLVDAAEADPTAGIAGPTVYYHDQPEVIWSAGGSIDWRQGDTWMAGINELDEGQFGVEPREVEFVSGCVLLVRREVLERVGLLDERFFLYYEETEWCVRAVGAGFKIMHVPQAKVWHKIRPQKQNIAPYVVYYTGRNRLLFLRESGLPLWRVISVIFLFHLRVALSWTVFPQHRDRRILRKVLLRSACDFLRGCFGPAPSDLFRGEDQ